MTDRMFLLLVISLTISFLITPLTVRLALFFGLTDDPKKRPHPAHTHKGIIPRAGGIPLYLGIFIPLFLFVPLNPQLLGIALGGLILVLTGLWDDKKDRSPYLRFGINAIAAVTVILFGISMPYITNPLGGIIHFDDYFLKFPGTEITLSLSYIIAVLWIVWTTNIVGWSGGIDGQMPGFVSISAIVIGLLSLRYSVNDPSQLFVTYLSFLTAGSFLGFLPWNFYPQKIMPGYGGKTLAGFLLAVLSILSYSKLGTAILVLAVPMTDAVFIFIRRIFAGKSPVWASTGHLHHQLLKSGWSKQQIAVSYWLISAIAGLVALTLSPTQKIFAGILIITVVSGFIFWISYLKNMKSGR